MGRKMNKIELDGELDRLGFYIKEVEGTLIIPVSSREDEELVGKMLKNFDNIDYDGSEMNIKIIYTDELVTCSDCGRDFFANNDNYVMTEFDVTCKNCLKNTWNQDEYIEFLMDNENEAFDKGTLDEERLKKLGWVRGEEIYHEGLNDFYSYVNNKPRGIAKALKKLEGKSVIFECVSTLPCVSIEYRVWTKESF